MRNQDDELIWVPKELAEQWKALSTEKATREEKEKVFNEYIQKATEQVRHEFRADLEAVEEDAAIFNGLMLKTRQAFEKAKNEHFEASEKLWDKFNDEIPSVTKKTEEILSHLKPITKELKEIETLLGTLNTWNIERFVEAFRSFNALSGTNKEMFEFLVKNFAPKAEV